MSQTPTLEEMRTTLSGLVAVSRRAVERIRAGFPNIPTPETERQIRVLEWLESNIASLLDDKARLDWLEEGGRMSSRSSKPGGGAFVADIRDFHASGKRKIPERPDEATLREAIDAARTSATGSSVSNA